MLLRRIIYENVETVEFRDRLLDALLATEDGVHIAGNRETLSAFLLHKTLGFLYEVAGHSILSFRVWFSLN